MPIKALLNNKPVLAWDVAGTGDFMCVECADKMHYRRSFKRKDGVRVTEHFAHNPTPTGGTPRTCSYVGQSEEHMNAKQAICLSAPDHFWWLNGIVGDVEVPLGDRRADVLFTRPDGRRIVFEPQFTKIPRSQIKDRTNDYHALGCDVIWCLGGKCIAHYDWIKQHFYCAGQMSDDGNDVTFWGNLNPEKNAPGLRRAFDADDIWATSAQLAAQYAPVVEHIPDPKSLAVSTVIEGNWVYIRDGYGDWRGTNQNAGIRTRLKGTLDWAKKDVETGRFQRRKNSEWIDDIRY